MRSRLKTALLVVPTLFACSKTLEEHREDFEEESGLTFEDCGAINSVSSACVADDEVECLSAAWDECRPAKLSQVGFGRSTPWGVASGLFYYVVPTEGRCEAVVFQHSESDMCDVWCDGERDTVAHCGVLTFGDPSCVEFDACGPAEEL